MDGVVELKALVGRELGHGEWLEVSQERVNRFAHANLDRQWIHVDPVRAKAGSTFG
jgi:acyl dehydratase